MKLSINLVHGGKYVRAGDELPPDFVLPEHLDRFAIYDDQPQTSRAGFPAFSQERHPDSFGVGAQPAKPATSYRESEEEFTPRFEPMRTKAKERKKL